jgi:hypothetical protein
MNIKSYTLELIDLDEYTNTYVNKIIKLNQFVEISKDLYLNKFTLLEIKRNGNKISHINIKHDIDNISTRQIKGIQIKNKVTDLQLIINYFNEI